LNLAKIGVSLTLKGEGPNSSRITPLSVASYGTATGHVIDLTGSLFVRLEDFQLGAYNTLPTPTTGLFLAQIASGQSNRIRLRNVYVSGKFATAAFYNYGVPSSDCYACDFYNYALGAGNYGVMYFTNTNSGALSSSFATVAGATFSTSDWSFYDTEWHKFAGVGADNWVVRLDGCGNISLFSGVVSGGGTAYVQYNGTNSKITYVNVTFETESEPDIPLYAHYKNSGTVTDLFDPQCSYILRGGGGTFGPGAATTTAMVSTAL
jgi:hypothetical protein